MMLIYPRLKIQNYFKSEYMDISNNERKLFFSLEQKLSFKIKSNFRSMHYNILCEGCFVQESTTQHTLECKVPLGRNELVTYLPIYKELYEKDEDSQEYIARIIKDNFRKLPQD